MYSLFLIIFVVNHSMWFTTAFPMIISDISNLLPILLSKYYQLSHICSLVLKKVSFFYVQVLLMLKVNKNSILQTCVHIYPNNIQHATAIQFILFIWFWCSNLFKWFWYEKTSKIMLVYFCIIIAILSSVHTWAANAIRHLISALQLFPLFLFTISP